jgi:hypothetical protein
MSSIQPQTPGVSRALPPQEKAGQTGIPGTSVAAAAQTEQFARVMLWCSRCPSAITIALLVIGIAIAGWADSFWLIYWTIVAVFTALAWGVVGPLRDRLRRSKRECEKSADPPS